MPSSHLLRCSVCNMDYMTKDEWTSHLIQEGHQVLARREIFQWTKKKKMKKCVILAYFKMKLSATDPNSKSTVFLLLKRLSKEILTFVTDFVWFEERPRLGFIQFESRQRLEAVLATLDSNSKNKPNLRLEIDGHLVEFRKAKDVLELEWDLLLPEAVPETEIEVEPQLQSEPSPSPPSPKISAPASATSPTSSKISAPATSPTTPPIGRISAPATSAASPPAPLSFPLPSQSSIKVTVILKEMLSSLLDAVRIPDSEFKLYFEVMSEIEGIFHKNPLYKESKVSMFRNRYLQLLSSSTNVLLFFITSEEHSDPEDPNNVTILDADKIIDIMTPFNEQFCRSGRRIQGCVEQKDQIGVGYAHQPSGLLFRLASHFQLVSETQRARLLQYYLTFDSRLKDLFALVFHWTRINTVRFDETDILFNLTYATVPDPGAIEWLLVTFLIREKIIPSVRKLQFRPHEIVRISSFRRHDFGFSDDSEFAKNWKVSSSSSPLKFLENSTESDTDSFTLGVLELAAEFFLFCATLDSSPCVVNTRDGEILPRDMFKKDSNYKNHYQFTKLTIAEFAIIRARLNTPRHPYISRFVNMVHPFSPHWRFSLNDKHFVKVICPQMRQTGKNLQRFVDIYKSNKLRGNELFFQDNDNRDVLAKLLKCS